MEFSPQGIPILTMQEKLAALTYCVEHDAWEDVAGHLCDLLAHAGNRIEPSVGPKFLSLEELVRYYGQHPTPIRENP